MRQGFKTRLERLRPILDPEDDYRDLKLVLFEEEWDELDDATRARYAAAPFRPVIIGTYEGGPQ